MKKKNMVYAQPERRKKPGAYAIATSSKLAAIIFGIIELN